MIELFRVRRNNTRKRPRRFAVRVNDVVDEEQY